MGFSGICAHHGLRAGRPGYFAKSVVSLRASLREEKLMKRSFARLSAAFAFALAAGTIPVALAAPAGAATPVQTCKKVTGSATFTPGLTNTPRDNVVKAKEIGRASCRERV